jgi:hypothetical protein
MSDALIQSVETAVIAATTDADLASLQALTQLSALETARQRLSAAVTTLQRLTTALAFLHGESAVIHSTGPASTSAGPVYDPAKPLPSEPLRRDIPDSKPAPSGGMSGAQCPGCGSTGTIVKIEGYKGTPYTVLNCTDCGWERNT